ncbi:MAG: V-type ATPase 116kDa subunit family protein [Rhabdochlamydiaceae bacterium]
MIINVKKYLILGLDSDLDLFFEKAQEEAFLEFIGQPKKNRESVEMISLIKALKILRQLKIRNSSEQSVLEKPLENPDSIVSKYEKIAQIKIERAKIASEIDRLSPLGDFEFDDLSLIAKNSNKIWQFFYAKSGKISLKELPDHIIYLRTCNGFDYFVSLSPDRVIYSGLIEIEVTRSIKDLYPYLESLDKQIRDIEDDLAKKVHLISTFEKSLMACINLDQLDKAKQSVSIVLNDNIFSSKVWVPVNKVQSLKDLVKDLDVIVEELPVEKDEKIPTCLDNTKFAAIGEDLVKIYDIPSSNDKDPSSWVFWSFILFFSIIISDAGYGLIYLLTALYLKYKHPSLEGLKKRFLSLLFVLSFGCIGWGVLVSGYFGLSISPDSALGHLSLLKKLAIQKIQFTLPSISLKEITPSLIDTYAKDVILEFSLVIGILHTITALFRYFKRNWANLGWVLFLIGGYLFFPIALKAVSFLNVWGIASPSWAEHIGLYCIYIGIGSACFLAVCQRGLYGLLELPNVIQIFSNVLSYVRLYALSLAGTIMAETFNNMGNYIGPIAGFIATILGHMINIQLGVMGGIIHGLRLNFLEWYHYCFEGNGKLFDPLKKIK